MIYVIIANQQLKKKVDISNYTKKDISKLIDTYMKCKYTIQFGRSV